MEILSQDCAISEVRDDEADTEGEVGGVEVPLDLVGDRAGDVGAEDSRDSSKSLSLAKSDFVGLAGCIDTSAVNCLEKRRPIDDFCLPRSDVDQADE